MKQRKNEKISDYYKEICDLMEIVEKQHQLPKWWWKYENEVTQKIKNGEIKSRGEMDELMVKIAREYKDG